MCARTHTHTLWIRIQSRDTYFFLAKIKQETSLQKKQPPLHIHFPNSPYTQDATKEVWIRHDLFSLNLSEMEIISGLKFDNLIMLWRTGNLDSNKCLISGIPKHHFTCFFQNNDQVVQGLNDSNIFTLNLLFWKIFAIFMQIVTNYFLLNKCMSQGLEMLHLFKWMTYYHCQTRAISEVFKLHTLCLFLGIWQLGVTLNCWLKERKQWEAKKVVKLYVGFTMMPVWPFQGRVLCDKMSTNHSVQSLSFSGKKWKWQSHSFIIWTRRKRITVNTWSTPMWLLR